MARRTFEEEQLHWANQLREDEFEFANLYLQKAVNGYTSRQCYSLTHPNASFNSAATLCTQMLRSYPVSRYIEACRQETISSTVMGLEELKEDLTIQVRGYDHLFDGVVSWESTPDGLVAVCDRVDLVPARLRKYVNGYDYDEDNETYILHLREYPGKESDRNKARELLAKMQGGLVDRREHTIKGALAHAEVTDDMDANQVAGIYKSIMTGKE